MRDKVVQRTNKVPLLGDVPVLGWLFKQRSTQVDKINLLFFLTPRILANYQNGVANQVKDVINRRNAHLRNKIGEEDPFAATVKGLYEKADRQSKGPLYDALYEL